MHLGVELRIFQLPCKQKVAQQQALKTANTANGQRLSAQYKALRSVFDVWHADSPASSAPSFRLLPLRAASSAQDQPKITGFCRNDQRQAALDANALLQRPFSPARAAQGGEGTHPPACSSPYFAKMKQACPLERSQRTVLFDWCGFRGKTASPSGCPTQIWG